MSSKRSAVATTSAVRSTLVLTLGLVAGCALKGDVRKVELQVEALRADLAKSDAARAPYVIIITGDDSAETRQSAAEYGADAFLAKPFTREALMSALSGATT